MYFLGLVPVPLISGWGGGGYFYLSGDLNRDFFGGTQNNLKIRFSARESTTKLVLRLF